MRACLIWLSGLFAGLFVAVRWPHFDVWLQSADFILGSYSNLAVTFGLLCLVAALPKTTTET